MPYGHITGTGTQVPKCFSQVVSLHLFDPLHKFSLKLNFINPENSWEYAVYSIICYTRQSVSFEGF